MIQAWVAFLRNGACIIKDILPGSHPVVSFKMPIQVLHYPKHVPALDLLIALLQLAAVAFGVLGGLVQTSKSLKKLSRAVKFRAGLGQLRRDRPSLHREIDNAEARLTTAVFEAGGSLVDGLISTINGACFYYLYLGTIGWVPEVSVIWALVVMEALLVVALFKVVVDILGKRARANLLLTATSKDLAKPAFAQHMVDYVGKGPLNFTWSNDLVPFHIQALISDVNSLARAYETLDALARATDAHSRADATDILHRAHKAGEKALSTSWLDGLIAVFDVVAFWGYFVIPATYFYNDESVYKAYYSNYPGHALVAWAGNLVGDVMWTVQPLVQLNSTTVMSYIEQPPLALLSLTGGASSSRRGDGKKEKEL